MFTLQLSAIWLYIYIVSVYIATECNMVVYIVSVYIATECNMVVYIYSKCLHCN